MLKQIKLKACQVTRGCGEVVGKKLDQDLLWSRNEVIHLITLLISQLVCVGFACTLQADDNTHVFIYSLVCQVCTAPHLSHTRKNVFSTIQLQFANNTGTQHACCCMHTLVPASMLSPLSKDT